MTERIQLPAPPTEKDIDGGSFSPIYTTTVTVEGGEAAHGRASGRARSDDGLLDLDLRIPAELGGDGRGTNPEQLFAAGFAACFHGALSLLARQEELDPTDVSVRANVALGRDPEDRGYLLRVDLMVQWPGADPETATALLERTESVCPSARMAGKGTPITITLVS